MPKNPYFALRIAGALLALSGCATSTTTLQSARTLAPKDFQVTAAASVPIATVVVSEILDTADATVDRLKKAEDAGQPLTEAELRQSIEAAAALVLFTPSAYPEAMLRAGIAKHFDMGLRLSPSLVKLDAKYQYLERPKVDASILLGYAYHFGIGPSAAEKIYDVFDYIGLGDFNRHDLDVVLLFGREFGEWLSLYGGPRYVLSFVSIDNDINDVAAKVSLDKTSVHSQIHQIGAVGGLMVGYRWIFFNLELTVLWSVFKPTILGEPVDLGGLVIAPTIGLTGKF